MRSAASWHLLECQNTSFCQVRLLTCSCRKVWRFQIICCICPVCHRNFMSWLWIFLGLFISDGGKSPQEFRLDCVRNLASPWSPWVYATDASRGARGATVLRVANAILIRCRSMQRGSLPKSSSALGVQCLLAWSRG